ncbi:hypothetical protein P152DRAFT_459865 [Eremomyces bilateralis CBS 781.70]|uniref:ASX DEUBAD domain-containing protein n=1 Tax=Eremomyces bilateralis CBS 781.70 TaxID=1392243 RepID=A0A6G1FZ93_9PEZI|nr:uncharacterized protein P152DRAFT_459865 [Eremomyces bilateralis CBS 781.70]KAF1810996.1 hypothetical protein P152DRAFT_459865 [Eremomyces bilateralis CBS 781.70]
MSIRSVWAGFLAPINRPEATQVPDDEAMVGLNGSNTNNGQESSNKKHARENNREDELAAKKQKVGNEKPADGANGQLSQEQLERENGQRWVEHTAFIRALRTSGILAKDSSIGINDILKHNLAWTTLNPAQQAELTSLLAPVPRGGGKGWDEVSAPTGHALYNTSFRPDCRMVGDQVNAGRYNPATLVAYARARK